MPRRTALSPIDLAFLGHDGYAVEFAFHYPYRLDARRLRKVLQRAFRTFWPVGGRLVPSREWSFAVESSREAPDLVELPGVHELPDFENPRALAPFSRGVATVPGEPLARFQLAHTKSGSLFVASISHSIVDGYSYFFFLSQVAALYGSSVFTSAYWKHRLVRPEHRREILREGWTAQPRQEIDRDTFFERTGLGLLPGSRKLPTLAEAKWEFIRFPHAETMAHLSSIQSELRLSKHDVVTALLWKQAAERWNTSGDKLECGSAFDYRRVLKLSPLYFGNAIRAAGVSLSRDEVLSLPLGRLAERIRSATASINRNSVIDSLRCAEELRLGMGADVFQRMVVCDPQHGFLVTNLTRMPSGILNFGQGVPTHVVPLTAVPRSAVLLSEGTDIVARLGLP